ncbi:MAG: hypothetical protein WCT39_07060 [Candidatus Margulisiibacteriota bacterium]
MRTYLYIAVIIIFLLLISAAYYYVTKPENSLGENTQQSAMTFFVTSANPGKGADLGGLSGADNYCQTLAATAGAGNRVWHAYLSTNGSLMVNARDRIGTGPWQNAQGVVIANNLEELHGNNNINKQTALTEKGFVINGRGDTPNLHDILTGSDPDGRAIVRSTDSTCNNWTSNTEGSAMLGHHDRLGLQDDAPSRSWNSSHLSRGCNLEALASTGGGGLFYCFAVTP